MYDSEIHEGGCGYLFLRTAESGAEYIETFPPSPSSPSLSPLN